MLSYSRLVRHESKPQQKPDVLSVPQQANFAFSALFSVLGFDIIIAYTSDNINRKI